MSDVSTSPVAGELAPVAPEGHTPVPADATLRMALGNAFGFYHPATGITTTSKALVDRPFGGVGAGDLTSVAAWPKYSFSIGESEVANIMGWVSVLGGTASGKSVFLQHILRPALHLAGLPPRYVHMSETAPLGLGGTQVFAPESPEALIKLLLKWAVEAKAARAEGLAVSPVILDSIRWMVYESHNRFSTGEGGVSTAVYLQLTGMFDACAAAGLPIFAALNPMLEGSDMDERFAALRSKLEASGPVMTIVTRANSRVLHWKPRGPGIIRNQIDYLLPEIDPEVLTGQKVVTPSVALQGTALREALLPPVIALDPLPSIDQLAKVTGVFSTASDFASSLTYRI